MKTKIDYNTFKSSLNHLARLQEFKLPLTKLWETYIMSDGLTDITDESMCEFFLIGDDETDYEDVDNQLEETTAKLARLLYLKEVEYKKNLELYNKQR